MKEVEYAKKLVYLSNQWYNDGLKKANIRDLSGAALSLKKSLQYNRDNIAARNLLGLVYYGRGEISEALVEWIISKNIKSHGNIANYYIKKVQESKTELETIDQAVKKFNQCLVYCQQNGEDLAAIQLKKVISAHPTFLKAYQLLALIYMQTEQYAKAKQMIRRAHRLDSTDETTLRYMHELTQLYKDKAAKLKTDRAQTVSYNLGNETIIQPVSATLKDNAAILTVLNIVIGLVVGAAVVGFLAVPTMKKKMASKTNKEIIVYSEQIATLESELDLQTKELEKYKSESKATEEEKAIAMSTQESYEALIVAIEHYNKEGYSKSKLADELLAINVASLGATAKTKYDAMTKEVFAEQCKDLYGKASESFPVLNYTRTIECLEKVVKMNEQYEDGEALYMLMVSYQKKDQTEKATNIYNRILELYPDKDVAKKATEFMKPAEETTQESTAQPTE